MGKDGTGLAFAGNGQKVAPLLALAWMPAL